MLHKPNFSLLKKVTLSAGFLLCTYVIIELIAEHQFYAFRKLPWPQSAEFYNEKGIKSCLGKSFLVGVRCYYHPSQNYSSDLTISELNEVCNKSGLKRKNKIEDRRAQYVTICDDGKFRVEFYAYYYRDESLNGEDDRIYVSHGKSGVPIFDFN